jgi:hypothetical protein
MIMQKSAEYIAKIISKSKTLLKLYDPIILSGNSEES